MKKQFLLLMFAFFASITLTFGQPFTQTTDHITLANGASIVCPTINPVTCGVDGNLAEELQPIVGKKYTYTVTVTPNITSAGDGAYHWFVTDATTFIDATGIIKTGADPGTGAGDHIMVAGTGYLDPTNATNSVDITWKAWATTDPVFLVIYVEDEEGCTDNIQAWKIDPRNAFTLDLNNLADNGTLQSDGFETCVSPVASAVWNGTDAITMNYGTNYLYYGVAAANFGDAWIPSAQLTLPNNYLTDTDGNIIRTIEVDWAYKADASANTNWKSMPLTNGVYTSSNHVLSNIYDNTVDGSCIVIRVKVVHQKEESLSDASITLAVDGEMFNRSGTDWVSQGNDVHYATWTPVTGSSYSGDCGDEDGFENDKANQIISARPAVIESNPAPDSFVPKN